MVISVMREIIALNDLKERLQAGFENNEESLEAFGKTYSTQLKAYLIESNQSIAGAGCPIGKWRGLNSTGWYGNQDENLSNTLFLDGTRERVWIIYSILDAAESDLAIKNWVESRKGLDRCWLSRKQLLHWDGMEHWSQSGLGLRFSDGLYPEDEAGKFSLKAWYGANRYIVGLDEVIEKAKERFAIYSARWQKRRNGSVTISAEWYSNGKATINRAVDVFEIDFTQEIDLDAFSNTVAKGTGDMKLWLVETEAETDFRRFRGVDLHTWDRVLLDVGPDFVYLTIPGKGCVNAAPRITTIQGEDNAGRTSIFPDGVEIFA